MEIFSSFLFRGLSYAAVFAVIEIITLCVLTEDEVGQLRFDPNLKGRTTWAMVPGSLLGGLYVLEPVYRYVRPFGDFWPDVAVRLLLWPVAIWTIEILWGAFLFYGCNGTRAWLYRGPGARLNGFIKLTLYPMWIPLGVILEIVFWSIRQHLV